MNRGERVRCLTLVLVIVPALYGSWQACAQAALEKSRVSIDLGSVTVWLGMPQADALLRLQSAGYQVLGDSAIRAVKDEYNNAYAIKFKDGQVIFASRMWLRPGNSEMDAILGALTELTLHGSASCSVDQSPVNVPGISSVRVIIHCGDRSVALTKTRFGSPNLKDTPGVAEFIGHDD